MLISYLLLLHLFFINHKIHCSLNLGPNDTIEVIKVYYKHDGEIIEHVPDNIELVNVTFESKLIIDFGSISYIDSIDILLVTKLEQDVKFILRENSPHDEINKSCTISGIASESLNGFDYRFVCRQHSRFGEFVSASNVSVNLISLIIKGIRLYSDMFIGCFTIPSRGSAHIASSFTDCLKDCHENSFQFAGVKMSQECTCVNNLTEFQPVDSEKCFYLCYGKYLCGSTNLIAIYSSDIGFFEKHQNIEERECIFNESSCSRCESGYDGIWCQRRDCSIDNGGCMDFPCQTFETGLSPISTCKCLDRFRPNVNGSCHVEFCSSDNLCDEESTTCVADGERYKCVCRDGFSSHSPYYCQDINECFFINRVCNYTISKCVNTVGSYYCLCFPFYKGLTQHNCQDIDECNTYNLCDLSTSRCINTYGSFRCKCLAGYERDTKYTCKDMNECNWERHKCQSFDNCVNTVGSYTCVCGKGLIKEVYNYVTLCQDIDECKNEKYPCNGSYSICINLYGSYSCECLPEFELVYGCRPTESVAQPIDLDYDAYYLTPFPASAILQDISNSQRILFLVLFVLLMFVTSIWLVCKRNQSSSEESDTV